MSEEGGASRSAAPKEEGMIVNRRTTDGEALGAELTRFCDQEEASNPTKRRRCGTCAFRSGAHVANGSPETLMNALKCVMERTTFYCHEADRPCVGWRTLVFDVGIKAPWDFVDGAGDPASLPSGQVPEAPPAADITKE